MTPPLRDAAPELFTELAELPESTRAARLAELDGSAPDLARELRTLLEADGIAGDFLGVLAPSPENAAGLSGEPAISTGVRIGPYRVVSPLGRGGMATVWLAHDERLDRPVALKFIAGGWNLVTSHGRDGRARLLSEARLAARLDHPNIASIYDVGETPRGEPYIAMAYCEGGSLANRIASAGPLPLADVVRVGGQLAAALTAAHARGVVHRDVKPANVLFDATGAVRLADFGIAGLLDQDATQSGAAWGTVGYLAPEQLRGDPIDARVDLWALGVTLYEMLAGRRPFDGGSRAAVLYGILAGSPDPIAPRAESGSDAGFAELSALVLRLLEKEPSRRPASTDVENTLARIAALLPSAGHRVADTGSKTSSTVASNREQRTFAPPPSLAVLTPLVGRERELALAAALLERTRLLTLTGPGGTGKTRLATELARLTNARYRDGVHIVALASTARPDLVASAIGKAVGVHESAKVSPDDRLLQYFAGMETLLVLDNFEHVLAAAPLVRSLLTASPRLTILATSRAPLRLQGEQEFPVPPLELPAVDSAANAIGNTEAVRLFVQRAQASRPDFALTDDNAADVAAICRRLDGLPLAIELAATRVKLFAPRALRARLEQRFDLLRSDARDVPQRQRTLRDAVDWSYDLLAPARQQLLRRLSVFVGGFTLDAAAAVGFPSRESSVDPASRESVATLDDVASLVDHSLIVRRDQDDGEPRFHMLETIREYTLMRLREANEEQDVRAAHRKYFLTVAEAAAPHLRGASQVAWLAKLEQEHDNLRAALDDAIAAGDVRTGTRLAVALQRFWLGSRSFIGQTIERLQTLDRQIETDATGRISLGMRGRLLTTLAVLSGVRGDHFSVPYRYHEAALAFYTRARDEEGVAVALNHLGWNALILGDLDRAATLSNEALSRHRAAGNSLGVATALVNLGWVSLHRGSLDDAERMFNDALAIHRERGEVRAQAYACSHVATTAVRQGDYARALALYEETRALSKPLGDRVLQPMFDARWTMVKHEMGAPASEVARFLESSVLPKLRDAGHAWSLGFVLACLGRILIDAGEFERARAVLDESLVVRRAVGDRSSAAESEWLLGDLANRSGDPLRAVEHWRVSLRERQTMGEMIGVAECLEAVARIALGNGDAFRSAQLLAAAHVTRERLGAPVRPRERAEHVEMRKTLEQRLGAESYSAACAAGGSLSLEATALAESVLASPSG